MNEFSRSTAEYAFSTCQRLQKFGYIKGEITLTLLDEAIDQEYGEFVMREIMELAMRYFDVFEPEELADIWWVVERELFRLVQQGDVFSFHGIQSIEEVAIAIATRTIAKMRREQRFPEIDHTEPDLLDFLVERGQQQLSLF